jgi:uncharacterized protein (AIM24 family)
MIGHNNNGGGTVNIQKPHPNNQGNNDNGGNGGLYSQLIGTRENIKLITKESYPQYGLDVEIIEYQKLLGSTNIYGAQALWFMGEQNIKCRQIGLIINNNAVKIESGAMSYFQGPLQCKSGINTAGKLVSQMFTGKLTGEKIVMPEYRGSGVLVLEPSFKHFLTMELGPGEQIICDKGMFYATSASVSVEPTWAGSASGTLLGGEGMFMQLITGPGVVILESPVPMCEINRIKLNNDVLRVDGNFALLRTGGVQMTVEPVSPSLVGSAMSGEGLVNVFRGTGEVWIAPTIKAYDALNLAATRGGNIAAVDMNTSTGKAK